MRLRCGKSGDRGSAVIEFILIGVAVMAPMVYVINCALMLQSAVLASTQAGREAARAFSMPSTVPQARQRANAAARVAFSDQGFEFPISAMRITCVDGGCLEPGSSVVVDINWRVPLPWLPDSWSDDATVPVSSRQRVPIDDYRGDQT